MEVVVTGGTGFVGRHVVTQLVREGFRPTVVGRNKNKLEQLQQIHDIPVICADIRSCGRDWYSQLNEPDIVIHLAWEGLGDFNSLLHLEDELRHHILFLRDLCKSGLKRIIVGGTCFEYGKQEGNLAEDTCPLPATPYAAAKNILRFYLETLYASENFSYGWLRYFYMYGEGQSPKTLFAQLEAAVSRGDSFFNMSGGEQLRDYLPVEEVAKLTVLLATKVNESGIFNICSGQPISVRRLVEERIKEMGAGIKLNLGYYAYPDYEPMAFWGDRGKLDKVLSG